MSGTETGYAATRCSYGTPEGSEIGKRMLLPGRLQYKLEHQGYAATHALRYVRYRHRPCYQVGAWMVYEATATKMLLLAGYYATAICLRNSYLMPGTDLAYAATRAGGQSAST
eukprot:84259-Rhodomonas_salina.2